MLKEFESAQAQPIKYPITKMDDVVDDYFGTQIADQYRWLEDVHAPEVAAWVQEQNEFTEHFLNNCSFRQKLCDELEMIVMGETAQPPFQIGKRWFQFRAEVKQDQMVLFCGSSARDINTVLLDIDKLSEAEGEPLILGATAISPDGQTVAFMVSRGGSDWSIGRFRDIPSGRDYEEQITGLRLTRLSWDSESKGVFYFQHEISKNGDYTFAPYRPDGVKYHRLGTKTIDDKSVGGLTIAGAVLDPCVSEDGEYFLLQGQDITSFRQQYIFYRPAADLDAEFLLLQNPDKSPLSFVGSKDGYLYIATFFDAPNGRVVRVPALDPSVEKWVDVVPEDKDYPLSSAGEAAKLVGEFVLSVHENLANNRILLTRLDGRETKVIQPPLEGRLGSSSGAYLKIEATLSADGKEILFPWTSPFIEFATIAYNIETGTSRFLGTPRSHLDFENCSSEVIWGTSPDGTRVPVTLFFRKDLCSDLPRPVMFYAYGHAGFSVALKPYRPERVVWMNNGGVLAMVHSRGGGEFGQAWHNAGIGTNQQNTFNDCIACIEAVQQSGWTTPEKSCFTGASGGGFTTGTIMTQRPDLIAGSLPEVGLFDMLRYHILASRATEEVGTSETEEGFDTIFGYSALQAVRNDIPYPSTLIFIGQFDNRVNPAHSYKFAAALQATKQASERPMLLRVELDEGHGTVRRASIVRSRADFLTFAAMTTGLKVSDPVS
ncbi:prolyl oligopeptidase family serine peptidase [Aquisediminimonas profunda]|uniref:prolyl oligopeptidase family serine peptidase n=1 Tax=Aquisediminimonas profunda TaxID=1550733 RepID=UPI001C6366EB|nr:prolyl oligopeptidase family serine peptidase [Aquisediminimonas profunda]